MDQSGQDGSSSGNNNGNGGVPTLYDYLQRLYMSRDLSSIAPLQHERLSFDLTRQRTVALDVVFEGTMSEFQALTNNGIPIRLSIADLVAGKAARLLPRPRKTQDSAQGVKPDDYDLDGVIVNSISLANTINTFSQAVGVATNARPPTYEEMRKEQLREMANKFQTSVDNENLIAHIPPTQTGEPDTRRVAVLVDVPTSYHGSKVARTFGGVTAKHMYRGVVGLSPEQAMAYGIARPPPSHDAQPAPDGLPQAQNTWNLVPHGHILAWMSTMPAAQIQALDYAVHQVTLPTGAELPFLLVDSWTIARHSRDIVGNALLKVDQNRLALSQLYVEIAPLKGASWIAECMPGMHNRPGYVAFTFMMTYTMFKRDFRDDPNMVFAVPPDFPRVFSQHVGSEEDGGGQGDNKRRV